MSGLTVKKILTMKPSQIKDWVTSSLNNELKSPSEFNWLGLADSLSFEARNHSQSSQTPFAEIAVTIYEWLANNEESNDNESYKNSANALRIYLLSNNLVDYSHPLLGIKHLEKWFWEGVDISLDQAIIISNNFRNKIEHNSKKHKEFSTEEFQQIQKVRRIKNRLQIIKSLPLIQTEIENWVKSSDKLL